MQKFRFLVPVLLVALIISTIVGAFGVAASNNSPSGATQSAPANANTNPKLDATLLAKFNAQPAGTKLEYIVVMSEQADTSNNIPNSQWAEKGWYVYNKLTELANRTQPAVRSQLDTLQKGGKVSEIHNFWIINAFTVRGDLSSAQTLAANPAIARVDYPGDFHIMDEPATLSADAQAVVDQALSASVDTVQHNINEVHAPQAWTAGWDGTGMTVGSMDTGTRWTHEALSARYRGNVAPPDPTHIHDYNWFDGYNVFTVPTDNNGHGSHTMGTILGTSPNNTYGNTGVAKGAMWMTVRICATSSCDATPILNGFQWTLAPTRVDGTQANPAFRPRVSNNSWGSSACNTADWQTAVTNWVNAGIFPDFSNGNSGPGAGTVGAPGSYVNSWGTGALDTSSSNWAIASFSSRGPSCFGGVLKPQAVAPGVNICSSINTNDTSYSCSFSGTSMAAPHVAGAVAILAQKNPNATIDQITNALTSTTFFSPTWGTQPNNNYGWGLIQVDAALNAVGGGTPTPTVTGTPPTATLTSTPTITPTPTATPCVISYIRSTSTGAAIVPGTVDSGNHADDGVTAVTIPFSFKFYGQNFTSINVSSNGNAQFNSTDTSFSNAALPYAGFDYAIIPHWDDLRTDNFTQTGEGIFTSVSGSSPNRIFNIEWRAEYYSGGLPLNFEARLYETTGQIDLIYGVLNGTGASATVGIQKGTTGPFDQFEFNTGGLSTGFEITYLYNDPCSGTATPTLTGTPPTATSTATQPVSTNTPTPLPCSTAWQLGAPYPSTIVRYAFAQVGSSFYIIGGVSDGTRVNTVNRYDVGSNTWTSLAPMPIAAEAPTAAYYNGKIYATGGDQGAGFYIYDIAGNSWTNGPSIPSFADTYGSSSGAFNGKVYIAGGSTAIGSTVEVYDIAANTWSAGTAAPNTFLLAGYQPVGQYLYVSGGFSSAGPLASNKGKGHAVGSVLNRSEKPAAVEANNATSLRLDMATGTWSSGPAFTPARADFGLAYNANSGKLYAIAGDATGGGFFDSTNLVDELDPSAWPGGAWASSPPNIPGQAIQANQAGFSFGNNIYSVGGLNGTSFQFLDQNYFRAVSCGTPTPTVTGTPPTATSTSTALPATATSTATALPPTPTQCPSAGLAAHIAGQNSNVYKGDGKSSPTSGKPANGKPNTQSSSTKPAALHPVNPAVVLYDQTDNPSTGNVTSQNFPDNPDYSNANADDFTVPNGTAWNVTEVDVQGQYSAAGPPDGMDVIFYADNAGLPGTAVASFTNLTTFTGGPNFQVTLPAAAVLPSGHYWVSVVADMSFAQGGQWYWTNRATQSGSPAAWENPGDGFGSGCTTWGVRNTCIPTQVGPDSIFLLQGTEGSVCPTLTPTQIGAPTNTATTVPATNTATAVPPTDTMTAVPPTMTMTGTATMLPTDTQVPTITPTDCPNPFVDINGNVFYTAIHSLYCRGIVNGVDATHYGPAGTASRAQFAKVVVLGFNIPSYTPATPTFTDVPITYFAYQYIEAGFHAGILSGYDAATCAAIGAAFPCYGPNRPITRGQLTKLVVVAGNCPLFTPTSGQTFTDVGPSNVFFAFIESAHNAGVINGYPDNTFRPNNNIRRDEMAQIVYKAILNCPGQGSITPTAVAPTNTVVAPTSTPGMANVSITNFAFTPQTITVTVGTTVMWQNNGSAHTVTSDTLGQFDSGNIPAGGSYSHQFTTAGSYAYHCEYHSGMTGTVIVTP